MRAQAWTRRESFRANRSSSELCIYDCRSCLRTRTLSTTTSIGTLPSPASMDKSRGTNSDLDSRGQGPSGGLILKSMPSTVEGLSRRCLGEEQIHRRGLPTKAATNSLCGQSNTSSGAPTCSTRPSRITTSWSARASASNLIVRPRTRNVRPVRRWNSFSSTRSDDRRLRVEARERLVHQDDFRFHAPALGAESDAVAARPPDSFARKSVLRSTGESRLGRASLFTRCSVSSRATCRSFSGKEMFLKHPSCADRGAKF